MLKQVFFAILLILSNIFYAQAQFFFNERVTHYAQYFNNQILYNPAYAGEADQANVFLTTRYWDRNNGEKPVSISMGIHDAFPQFISSLGFVAEYHNFADNARRRILKLGLVHNFNFDIGTEGVFKLGFNLSLLHYNSNQAPFFFTANPGSTLRTNERFFKYNVDIGALLTFRTLKLGGGIQHTNEPSFQFFVAQGGSGAIRRFYRQAFLSGSYTFEVLDFIEIQPMFMVNTFVNRNVGFNPFDDPFVDLGVLFTYEKWAFLGIHHKINNDNYNWSIAVGGRILDTYQISASYDIPRRNIGQRHRIELSLGFFFNKNQYEEEMIEETNSF